MSKTSHTASILEQLSGKSAHRQCFVLNPKRQLHVFDVISWNPQACSVVTQAPKGRNSAPNPEEEWQVTVRTNEGAYTFEVVGIEETDKGMTFKLAEACRFAARRAKVRLQTESRNPVMVHFMLAEEGEAVAAELVDFSREGLGLDWSQKPTLETGMPLYKGQFRVCAEEVTFDRAEVVHAQDLGEDRQRIGIRFTRITGKQASAIKSAFDSCFLMQPYVSSTALDS